MEVEPEQISSYGCAAIKPTDEDDVVAVTDLVEKPDRSEAPSNWIVIGRYVCDPAIFDVLERDPAGPRRRDPAHRRAADPGQGRPRTGVDGGGVHGVLFSGRRYDTGNKLDYLRTLVQFACERPDLAAGVRALAARLPGSCREPGRDSPGPLGA